MAETIYILCAVTSAACCALLFRTYLGNRTRLLLWSSLGFLGLMVNNLLLVLDRLVYVDVDLWLLRSISVLAGLFALLVGLLWSAREAR